MSYSITRAEIYSAFYLFIPSWLDRLLNGSKSLCLFKLLFLWFCVTPAILLFEFFEYFAIVFYRLIEFV